MNKKKLDPAAIQNEFSGASAFFRQPTASNEAPAAAKTGGQRTPRQQDATPSRRLDTTAARRHAVTTARPHDAEPSVLSSEDRPTRIGHAVRALGTERTTTRFSPQEKTALEDLVYTQRRRGVRTTENELTRIAVNWLVEDHHEHGEESLLAQVLAKLQDRPRDD